MRSTSIPQPAASIPLRIGVVDVESRQIRALGRPVQLLTSREIDLLLCLADASGEVVGAEELLEAVWGRRWTGEPTELGVVRNTVFKLRQKVERNINLPEHILTVQGEGYRFVPLVTNGGGAQLREPFPDGGASGAALAEIPEPGQPWEPTWDVGWEQEEARAQTSLEQPGRPLLIQAPWRAGKSWFLRRLLSVQRSEDCFARLDPRAMPPETLANPAEFIEFLALIIGDALGLTEEEVEVSLHGRGPAAWRFRRWMGRTALPCASGRLFLVIEDLDRLARAPVFGELVALLRSQADEDGAPWARLRTVTTSRASVTRLTSGLASSPFNLGMTVVLPPFGPLELARLSERAGLRPRPEELEGALRATGGHPWLLHLLLAAAARSSAPLHDPKLLSEALAPAAADLSALLAARPELHAALSRALAAKDPPPTAAELDALVELGLLEGARPPHRASAPALTRLLL